MNRKRRRFDGILFIFEQYHIEKWRQVTLSRILLTNQAIKHLTSWDRKNFSHNDFTKSPIKWSQIYDRNEVSLNAWKSMPPLMIQQWIFQHHMHGSIGQWPCLVEEKKLSLFARDIPFGGTVYAVCRPIRIRVDQFKYSFLVVHRFLNRGLERISWVEIVFGRDQTLSPPSHFGWRLFSFMKIESHNFIFFSSTVCVENTKTSSPLVCVIECAKLDTVKPSTPSTATTKENKRTMK